MSERERERAVRAFQRVARYMWIAFAVGAFLGLLTTRDLLDPEQALSNLIRVLSGAISLAVLTATVKVAADYWLDDR
jgi:hypothetical protein